MKKIEQLSRFVDHSDDMVSKLVLLDKINEVVDEVNDINNQMHWHDPDNVSSMVGVYKKPDACPACADKPPNPLEGMPGVTFKDVTPHSEDCPNNTEEDCLGPITEEELGEPDVLTDGQKRLIRSQAPGAIIIKRPCCWVCESMRILLDPLCDKEHFDVSDDTDLYIVNCESDFELKKELSG